MGWSAATLIFPLVSWILLRSVFVLRQKQLFKLSLLCFAGLLFDCTGVYFNLIELTPPGDSLWLPLWLISLWLLFVSSLPLLQTLFQKKYLLASLLGALGGPLSYRAGSQFGLLQLNGTKGFIVYALFWAVYIPGAVYWLETQDGVTESRDLLESEKGIL